MGGGGGGRTEVMARARWRDTKVGFQVFGERLSALEAPTPSCVSQLFSRCHSAASRCRTLLFQQPRATKRPYHLMYWQQKRVGVCHKQHLL